jgi:hypothetical protein
MWNNYRGIDEALWRIAKRVRLLLGVNPLQASIEQLHYRFFRSRHEGSETHLSLSYYPPQPDLQALESALEQIQVPEGPLGPLYEAKCQELLNKVRLLAAVGRSHVTTYSQAVYGRPSADVVRRAEAFIRDNPPEEWSPRELSASVLKERFSQALASRGLDDWSVVLRTEGVVGVNVNHRNRTLEVHAERSFNDHDISRLIVHEIDTHILRRKRGEETGLNLFAFGTAGYLATEEGLAVFQEGQQDVLENNRLRIYAGQVLAVNTALIGGFRAVFDSLRARGFSDEEAFHLTLRTKRGLADMEEPGAFTKDHCYFTGKCLLDDFSETGGRVEELLLFGKIGIDDLPLLRQAGLISGSGYLATA